MFLEPFIDALREELKASGEMVALLDYQQGILVLQSPRDLLQRVFTVAQQGSVLHDARALRRALQEKLAGELHQSANIPSIDLIDKLPPDYQPLVAALLEENQRLFLNIQERAQQSHEVFGRCTELVRQLLDRTFQPDQSSQKNGRCCRSSEVEEVVYAAVA